MDLDLRHRAPAGAHDRRRGRRGSSAICSPSWARWRVIGLIPTAAIFVIVFMRLEGPERWKLVIPYAAVLILGIYVAFDWFMSHPLAADPARPARAGARKSSRRCSSRTRYRRRRHAGGAAAQHRRKFVGFARQFHRFASEIAADSDGRRGINNPASLIFTCNRHDHDPRLQSGDFGDKSDATCAVRSTSGGNSGGPGLALTPYASSAFAATERRDPAAVPMPRERRPAAAEHQGPCPGRPRQRAGDPRQPRRASPRRRDRDHQFGAGSRQRQVHHGRGRRRRDRRQAARATGRRKIRPHPRRQEGARDDRSVLLRPRLRAALDRRRRHQRARQGRGRLSRAASTPTASIRPTIRCRRSRPACEPEALAEAEIKFTDSVLTFARHAMTGRVHFSRVAADILYDLGKPEPADVLAKHRQRDRRRRSARQPQPAAAAVQGAEGQARRSCATAPTTSPSR